MYFKLNLIVSLLYGLELCDCYKDEWTSFERSLKYANREELFISNAIASYDLKLNFTVEKWRTLTVGRTCYTGGLTSNSTLVILFSTLLEDGSKFVTDHKVFDMNVGTSNFDFFHHRKHGKDYIMILVYNYETKTLEWYTLRHYFLNRARTWPLGKEVLHFQIFKMDNKNMLLAINKNDLNFFSTDIYEFKPGSLDYWFYQSIPLQYPTNSPCVTTTDSSFYLSIPQKQLDQLQIHQFSDNHFTPYQNLSAPEVDQVICFENGFKSFIAINGLEAGIYEVTEDGFERETIVNSHLEGITFWMPIPVNTYRDETILLSQRRLNHDSHFSFDVDVITYNGQRFEEHEDIPCLLFGEQQNRLKCLTEYNPKTGIEGSSYIAISNLLSLIVPVSNGTFLLFHLDVGIRSNEHPAKKEFEFMLQMKNKLQSIIDEQNEEAFVATERRKKNNEKSSSLRTQDSLLETKSNPEKILKLRDEIEEFERELNDLKEKARNQNDLQKIRGKFKAIIFNGPVEIGKSLTSENIVADLINLNDADDLLNDIVRKKEMRNIDGHKTFLDLTVNDISFENVNGIPSENLITIGNGKVSLVGDIRFNNDVTTENVEAKLVNNVDVDKNWVEINQILEGSLNFDQIEVKNSFNTQKLNGKNLDEILSKMSLKSNENINPDVQSYLFIPGNVTVSTLNGENFGSFLDKLCMKNITCHIPNLKIDGILNVTGTSHFEYLNDLKFPEEFVSTEPSEPIMFKGHKEFTNITRGYKVVTNSTVNSLDLEKIIKRSDGENILQNITFNNLEVVSILKVNGTVKGEGLDQFAPNLGLKDTNVLKSNVHFYDLEVRGNIIVESNFNGTNFQSYLQDFIFKDEKNATIIAKKTLLEGLTARQNLHIYSNKINNISLDMIITKSTPQQLEISSLTNTADFENLYVEGYFDGELIDDLNDNFVKTSQNQSISSELVFLQPLTVEKLIFDEINNSSQQTQNFSPESGPNTELSMDELDVEELIIEGNVIGNIWGFELSDFSDHYLSYTKDQALNQPYYIDKLTVNNFEAIKVNDMEAASAFSYVKLMENITDMLVYRTPKIDYLNAEGSIHIAKINDQYLNVLVENHPWTKLHDNTSTKSLQIDGDVYFETVEIKKLAGVDFEDYVNSLVFKNETEVEIENCIVFENGIKVEKLIETKTLNDVDLDNILRKDGEQIVLGPVEVVGNVAVENDLNVKFMVNDVDVNYIKNNLDVDENSARIKGEVMFIRLSYIHNLNVNGSINGLDVDEIKSNFVFLDGDVYLQNTTVFKEKVLGLDTTLCVGNFIESKFDLWDLNPQTDYLIRNNLLNINSQQVRINGNLGISSDINGIRLSDFVSKIVWITQDTDIQGSVRFTLPVESYKSLNIDNEMNTNLLFGQNLEKYINNAVFLDKGLLKGSYTFESITINDFLRSEFINNLNTSNVIPLKSDQEIETLEIGEVETVNNIPVGNKINGVILAEEYNRTLLKNVEQELFSEMVFLNNVMVEDALSVQLLNDKPTSKIVTINTDQNLTAVYSFNTKCWINKDLLVDGLVDGVNLTFWKNNSVLGNMENSQKIHGEWTMAHDLNVVGPLLGNGVVNGLNITELINDVREKGSYKYDVEKGIFIDYHHLCTDVSYIYKNAKKQIYKFKYFEELQKIQTNNSVQFVKHFQHQDENYLLINERDNCLSRLMVFRQNSFRPVEDIHTGVLSQAAIVQDIFNTTFLVTTGGDAVDEDTVCLIRFSTVVWKFENQSLNIVFDNGTRRGAEMSDFFELLAHFENQELLQESQVPSSFYGLKNGMITEFKVEDVSELVIRRYRSWNISEENAAFLPRGLKTGLTLRTGEHLIYLNRNDPVIEDDFGVNTEAVIKGTFRKEWNAHVPGRIGGDVAVINAGTTNSRKNLLAVSSHKESKVEHRLDIIEIYLNPFTGELFDKIPTFRPSCLTSIEFDNGETLFVFMEENKVLQIFEYKGIEGFKHRSSIKIPARELILMNLPKEGSVIPRKVLGLIHNNEITVMEATMMGNRIDGNLMCMP